MVNCGLLTAEICWQVWSKFQQVSCLGSVTARHSSSGHQPSFVALNRGRNLYSTGRPSRWALARISSYYHIIEVLASKVVALAVKVVLGITTGLDYISSTLYCTMLLWCVFTAPSTNVLLLASKKLLLLHQ